MSKVKSDEKERLLLKNGYKYHFERMIYFNLKTKKVFSFEAIDDNPITWIKQRINKENINDWEFYWSSESPKEQAKMEIISELTHGR